MVDIGAQLYWWAPIRWLMRNRYPSAERIAGYDGPLLQMHGTDDRLIPLDAARRLFDACPSQQKRFLEMPGMGHNDPAPKAFFDAFELMLSELPPTNDTDL